jgi:hypothetical protein
VESTFKSNHSMQLKSNGGPWKWTNRQSCHDIICTCGTIRK